MAFFPRRVGTVLRLTLTVVALSSVVVIGMSQTLADWWSGADSGYAILDGPIGAVRAMRSVLEFGWLDDGLGVHVVMWSAVALVLMAVVRDSLPPAMLPLLAGAMAAMGIVLELMQGAWTLRDVSIRDILGNLAGVGLGALWATRAAWNPPVAHGAERGRR